MNLCGHKSVAMVHQSQRTASITSINDVVYVMCLVRYKPSLEIYAYLHTDHFMEDTSFTFYLISWLGHDY